MRLYTVNPDGSKKWDAVLGAAVRSSPAIATDGTVYICREGLNLYAFHGNSGGLAESGWPMFHSDPALSGLYKRPRSTPISAVMLLLLEQ
jgi:hypothetical protein